MRQTMKSNPITVNKMIGLTLVFAVVLAAPLRAGIYFESVTTDESQKNHVEVHSWVEGEKAKIEFVGGLEKGMMPKDSYLVTSDGGKTVYLVNPKEQTYSRWDLEAMLRTFGQVMEAMGPMMNLSIDDPQVTALGQEAGGTIAGLPTTKYRYRTTYDLNMKIMGMNRGSHIESEQEIWATQALQAPGMGVWLRADRPTGFEGLDKLIKAEMSKVRGFPLKTVTVTTTTNHKGNKERTSRSTTEVTVLDRSRSIPDSTFGIPDGYRETEMMPLDGSQGESATDRDDDGKKGRNPLKKIFGGG